MFDSLLSLADLGNYVSAVKLVLFLVAYFPALALVAWVYQDSRALGLGEGLWTAIVAGAVFVGALLVLIIPVFWGGLALFLVGVAGLGFAYVKQRNSKVLDFDKVLTAAHIKSLFGGSEDAAGLEEYSFISAHGNEVPRPEPKTPDFFGFRSAYDILSKAIRQRVESLRLVPAAEGYKITVEIDGAPLEQPELPKDQADYFVRFMKLLADLDVKERRKPQKGTFKVRKGKETFGWEIRTAGSTVGEQILLRSKAGGQALRLDDIGLAAEQLKALAEIRATGKEGGVFLISGPRRSGLTSTLYAILREHDAYLNNINTLEREIVGNLPSVTQEVYALSDTATTTFAKKLEQMLRMGPDIVGVAECPDAETARTICQGGADGKLIYVIIEADSVAQATGKWLKLVGDRELAVSHLRGILNQRLVRQLCEECKQGYQPNQEILKKFNLPADKAKVLYRPGKVVYSKRGKESNCEACQATGFRGRTGIFEMITFDDALRAAVKAVKSLPEINTQFRRAKMLYLQEQALRKVMAGTTAINEMVRVLARAKKARPAPKKPSA